LIWLNYHVSNLIIRVYVYFEMGLSMKGQELGRKHRVSVTWGLVSEKGMEWISVGKSGLGDQLIHNGHPLGGFRSPGKGGIGLFLVEGIIGKSFKVDSCIVQILKIQPKAGSEFSC
jgi:hypothetical protein